MTRIALIFAAAALVTAPAALAAPQGQGQAKGEAKARANHGAAAKGHGGAAVKAQNSAKVRTSSTGTVRRTADSGGSWSYKGRQYDQFDLPAYRVPPGQAKKVFNTGERLPAAYYAQNPSYVLQNPSQYQLQPAPAGYQWVRVDNDVYLVRSQTGVITDAIRSIFR